MQGRPICTSTSSTTIEFIAQGRQDATAARRRCSTAGSSRARCPTRRSTTRSRTRSAFEHNFPADFIAEGLDQTRGWFYTLLVLSTALFGKPAFKNVIVNGLVLAEDGQKMSKRQKNYPDPERGHRRVSAPTRCART